MLKEEEIVFLREEFTNRLSNIKWTCLKTCQEHHTGGDSCIYINKNTYKYICTHTHTLATITTTIKEREALEESKVKTHGRSWREEREGGKLHNYNLKKLKMMYLKRKNLA